MSIDTTKIKDGDWQFEVAESLAELESVLCDPEGRACIDGGRGDLNIIDSALDRLRNITAHRASEPAPVLERDPMCDAEWEHLLKTAQRGRIMEVGGMAMKLVEANDLLRQWRKLYDLGIEDFMPSFAHPVVGELYDKTMEYLTDEQPENLKPNITMEELEATNKAVEELTKPQSEKAPEVSDGEWLTEYEFNWCWTTDDINLRSRLNALLTRKLREGKLPVVSKADMDRKLKAMRCAGVDYEELSDMHEDLKRNIAKAVFWTDAYATGLRSAEDIRQRVVALGITPALLEGGAE